MRRVTPDTIAVVDLAVCDRCGLCLPLCPPEAIHLELNVLTVDDAVCADWGLGWLLDRTRFDAHLPAAAAAAGAEVLVGAEATGMSRNGDERWHVRVKERGREHLYRAGVVIGADGVETMVGRWAGLDTRVPARDMESCAQYVLQGIDFNPDAIYLQFSNAI